jgi:hypothetical protein
MESFEFLLQRVGPRKPNSIPPLKPIHFEKEAFSAAPKIACKGRSITAIAPLFMNCGL